MDEKIIIEGKKNKTLNMILLIVPLVFIVISLFNFIKLYSDTAEWLKDHHAYSWNTQIEFYCGMVFFIIAVVLFIIYIYCAKSQITVTDKRVYGRAVFGRRIDLPMDSISAVGTMHFLNGISVATSSGTIKFKLISNNAEIHKAISELLVHRQNSPSSLKTSPTNIQSDANELKQFKQLLDDGTITQEEFDAKKKQLLGL